MSPAMKMILIWIVLILIFALFFWLVAQSFLTPYVAPSDVNFS